MNFSEELSKAMSPHGLIELNLFGMKLFITDTIVSANKTLPYRFSTGFPKTIPGLTFAIS